VKEYLLDKVHLLRIHRYDPASSMFDDALVSSAVVWFSNEKVPEDYPVEFTYGGTVEEPALAKTVWRTELRKERKWTRFPEHEVRQQGLRQTKIKDAFIVKRGIATGDNSFFILDKKRIEAFGLRRDYLVPILPSPRHLDATEIFANECGDPIVENPLYLINCDLPERQIETMYPELLDYLKTGNDTVANRYLCKTKKHWYQQEQRESAPILCTYMGRGNRIDRAPFRFILNHSRAIATNSYLMLYPRDEYKTALQRNPQLLKGLWQTLNDLPSDFLTTEGRVYGGGLKKIEPKELGEVVCSSDLTQAQTTMNLALA
jgi:hypothetical protein